MENTVAYAYVAFFRIVNDFFQPSAACKGVTADFSYLFGNGDADKSGAVIKRFFADRGQTGGEGDLSERSALPESGIAYRCDGNAQRNLFERSAGGKDGSLYGSERTVPEIHRCEIFALGKSPGTYLLDRGIGPDRNRRQRGLQPQKASEPITLTLSLKATDFTKASANRDAGITVTPSAIVTAIPGPCAPDL